MAQHVRVDGEGEIGRHPNHRQLLSEPAALIGVRRVDQQHDRLLGLVDQFLPVALAGGSR